MRETRKAILIWLGLLPVFAVTLFPFAVMGLTAIRPQDELFTREWFPSRIALGQLRRDVADDGLRAGAR